MAQEPYRCNLVVPGAPKAGTTALAEMLDHLPDVCMSRPKEPQFFANDSKFKSGPSFHNALFLKQGARRFGDASTSYCLSRKARTRIKECCDDVRIVFCLRHPIARTWSHYRFLVRQGIEKRSLVDACCEDGVGFSEEKSIRGLYPFYLEFSRYSQMMRAWYDTFPQSQILMVSSEEVRQCDLKFVEKISSFLEIRERPSAWHKLESNRTEDAVIVGKVRDSFTAAARLIPGEIKHASCYRRMKAAVLGALSPSVPKQMTKIEKAFLLDVLAEEVEFFEGKFDCK